MRALKADLKKCKRLLFKKISRINQNQNKQTEHNQHLSEEQNDAVNIQLKASTVRKRGMRWRLVDKRRALALYNKSPAAYRHESNVWKLPHRDTLLKHIKSIYEKVMLNNSKNNKSIKTLAEFRQEFVQYFYLLYKRR